jgi:hypothetical protein
MFLSELAAHPFQLEIPVNILLRIPATMSTAIAPIATSKNFSTALKFRQDEYPKNWQYCVSRL